MTKKTSKLAKNIMLIVLAVYLLMPFFAYVLNTFGALRTIRATASVDASNIDIILHHLGSYSNIGDYIQEYLSTSKGNSNSFICKQIRNFMETTGIFYHTDNAWIVDYIAYCVDGFIMYALFYTITIVPTLIGGWIEHER